MSRHTKFAILLGALAAILVFVAHAGLEVFHIPFAGAQVPPPGGAPAPAPAPVPGGNAGNILGPENGLSGTTIDLLTRTARFFLSIINFLTWILFYFLDRIMDPEFIFDLTETGEDGALLFMLREIWQFTRDLVNVFLALLLIGGAITMIVTSDTAKVKERLPKFIVALVLVNFSWFIPRAIFDASQIAAYTAYQIPSLLGADGCTVAPSSPDQIERQPCEIVTNMVFFEEGTAGVTRDGINTLDGNSPGWKCPVPGLICYQSLAINAAGAADAQPRSKILNGLVINQARLSTLTTLIDPRFQPGIGPVPGENPIRVFQRILSFLAKLIVVMVLNIALFFPILALTVAFFIRIPILWVTIAFMPLVAVGYVFGDKLKDFNPMEVILKQFMNAVFLPVKVAVPFAIGFIMINAGSQAAPPQLFGDLAQISLFGGIRDLWQLFWMIVALAIIWKYSFQVLKQDELLGKFTEKIQGFGQSIGQIAYRYPLSLPIVPVPGRGVGQGKGISPIQALQGFNPAAIAQDLRTGSIPDLADRARIRAGLPSRGSGGAPPGAPAPGVAAQAQAVQVLKQPPNAAIRTRHKGGLGTLSNNAQADDPATNDAALRTIATRELAPIIQDIRRSTGNDLVGISDRDIVAALATEYGLNAARMQAFAERLANGGNNTN